MRSRTSFSEPKSVGKFFNCQARFDLASASGCFAVSETVSSHRVRTTWAWGESVNGDATDAFRRATSSSAAALRRVISSSATVPSCRIGLGANVGGRTVRRSGRSLVLSWARPKSVAPAKPITSRTVKHITLQKFLFMVKLSVKSVSEVAPARLCVGK
jgi:hypothetical protein